MSLSTFKEQKSRKAGKLLKLSYSHYTVQIGSVVLSKPYLDLRLELPITLLKFCYGAYVITSAFWGPRVSCANRSIIS